MFYPLHIWGQHNQEDTHRLPRCLILCNSLSHMDQARNHCLKYKQKINAKNPSNRIIHYTFLKLIQLHLFRELFCMEFCLLVKINCKQFSKSSSHLAALYYLGDPITIFVTKSNMCELATFNHTKITFLLAYPFSILQVAIINFVRIILLFHNCEIHSWRYLFCGIYATHIAFIG